MSYQKGRQQYLVYAVESPRLTAAVAGFKTIPFAGMKAEGNKNTYRDAISATGRRAKQVSKQLVSQHAEFGYNDYVHSDLLLFPLFSILGGLTAVTSLGATTWTLAVTQNLETATSTIQYNTNEEGQKRIRGFVASKLDLDFSVEDATFNLEGTGVAEETGTNITPTFSDPNQNAYLLGRHMIVSYANSQSGLTAGTVLADVKNVKISFESGNDISRNKVLGSLTPTNNTVDGFSMTVEFDLISANAQSSVVNSWNNSGSQVAFRFDANGANYPIIGTSTLKPRLFIDIPPSVVEVTREIPIDDYLMQKCKITVNNADLITGQLINSIPTI
jgi:hypothetical protein